MNLTQPNTPKKNSLYILGLILAFCLVYYKLIYAGFVSWDDAEYITDNKDARNVNWNSLLTHFYVGNYHPLTMLNYALDWKLFGQNPIGYHLENILWHFLNSILVFYVAYHFLKEKSTALLVTIVFAIHPIQVETIAWVAERKNLLSTFFILVSLLFYVKYSFKNKFIFYLATLLFFCFSLLCKPSFIIFPLLLILMDWQSNQKITKSHLLQKIPFIVISILFSFITIKAQQEGGFINSNHAFGIFERIGYAGYAITQYIYHFINPTNLSVIYPYPQNKIISLVFGYFFITILGFIIYKLIKTKNKNLLFGIAFFIINLILVLQFVPFGEVLTADRYMYFAIIGLSIVLFTLIKIPNKHIVITSTLLVIALGSLSFLRLNVWKNSIALYEDILLKNPRSYIALNSLGAEYMKRKEYALSEKYYNKSIFENSNSHKSFYNRALLYSMTNETKKAIADYTKAIELANYYKAYIGRANIYYLLKDFPKAINDAEKALVINPNNAKANFVLANCYDDLNQLDKALYYYNQTIISNNEDASFYLRRGILFGKQQQFDLCLNDLETCTTLQANYAEAYYWKGVVKVNLKQNPCFDLKKALDLGFLEAEKPLYKYCQ